MKLALSTDHAGFEQLRQLQAFLEAQGHVCINYGPEQLSPDDDYPDYIRPAAKTVAAGECEAGIIFGSSGEGEAMVANRVQGVRCGVYYGQSNPSATVDAEGHTAIDGYEILRLSRQHNHANMLSLAGRFLSFEEVKTAVSIWLDTPYSDEDRHKRRVAKIDQL